MSDLERKILARLVDSPENVTEAWDEGVRAEVFEQPLYQAVWNFTVAYWQKAQMKSAPTLWALQQEFPGYETIVDFSEETYHLAALLRRRFVTNQLQTMIRTATDSMHSDPVGSLKALHAEAYTASEVVAPRLTRTNMAETVEERRLEYAKLEEYPQGIGVPYGFDLLDLHTGGLLPGEIAVLGASAKTGKTMFGLHVCAQAVRKGYRPLIYTLEMSLKECTKRLDAMFSGVSYNRLLHGHLNPEELAKLHEAQDELASLGGIQLERPEDGDRTVAALLARARQYGADFLFIDQLSHMEPGVKTDGSLKAHHSVIMKALKSEVSRAGAEIPCLLAAQLRQGDEEVTLESFANAAEISREADILMGLHRNQDLRNNHLMVAEILGARRCDNAKYLLKWELLEATEFAVNEEIR